MTALWDSLFGKKLGQEGEVLAKVLRHHALFEDMDSTNLVALRPALRVKEFQDEEIVCHCPDATHDAFVLLEGVASVTRRQGDDVHVVDLSREGSVHNVGPLLGMEKEPGDVRALGKVRILAMDHQMLTEAFEREPQLGYQCVRLIARLVLEQVERELEGCLASR